MISAKSTLTAILLAISGIIAAQTKGSISVTIVNENQEVLENASVELLRANDSTLVKAALSNQNGGVEFDGIPYGTYLLRAAYVNRQTIFSSDFELNAASFKAPALELPPLAAEMQGVTIASRKPFIQKLTDRIVVNVNNSIISAGSSAFDVLERSPGVQIDPNDNINLRGRQGVIIMIDGKPSPMTGADLVNFLRGLPSNAIERIEIITNPSARYDAAGNSGIIDIRMKKDQRLGMNGNITAGYGQGVYPKANAGGAFNYRNRKLNIFGNYNYSYRLGLNHLILDRNFYDNGVFTGADYKDNYTTIPFRFHTARAGMDYFPNKKTILGVIVNTNFNHFSRKNDNHSIVIDQNKEPYYLFETLATNNDRFNNMVANLNFKHSFDTTGRELTADVDYGFYKSHSLTTTSTVFKELNGDPMQPPYILDGDQWGDLRFRAAKADYIHPLGKPGKIEAGLKSSLVSSDNDARFYDMSNGLPVDDVNKTNRFYYDEYNNAGYINYSAKFGKVGLQFGLRGEHTNVKTKQVKGDISWDSSYFQLFPSAFLNYDIKEGHTVGFSVSRRIDRPGYSQLNPFLFLIDITTYATGSPGLLPQITWSYEASYNMKNLSFSFNYSRTNNPMNVVIARFKDVFPDIPADDNVTVQVPVNLEQSEYYGVSISAPLRLKPWWNLVANGDMYYNRFNGNLGGVALDDGAPSARVNINNSFSFKKGWSAELGGVYNTSGRSGYMVYRPSWGVSAGVQKNIMEGKGQIRLNVSDIFWTNLPRATIIYDGAYIEKWRAYRESRVANLSFTYRFGNSKVQAARRRTTASEEERRRAG